MDPSYLEAVSALAAGLQDRLKAAPTEIQRSAREICLRAERPLVLSTLQGPCFMRRDGSFAAQLPASPYVVTKEELDECVRVLTEYSLHSYRREINGGYLTVRGGHRAGVCGSAVCGRDEVLSVTDISCINLRIARQIRGSAGPLAEALYQRGVSSTLIAGPPASGKTTLLKDLCRILGGGELGFYKKISLIDERGELAAVWRGVPQNEIGIMTDVLDGYPKGLGMNLALRSLSPEVMILDELAGEEDARSIRQSLHAGCAVIASVHAGSLEELSDQAHIRRLLQERSFAHVVLLRGAGSPCEVKRIIGADELYLYREAPSPKGRTSNVEDNGLYDRGAAGSGLRLAGGKTVWPAGAPTGKMRSVPAADGGISFAGAADHPGDL